MSMFSASCRASASISAGPGDAKRSMTLACLTLTRLPVVSSTCRLVPVSCRMVPVLN